MKELMILESETRINSVELVEIINQFRQLEGKSDLLHKNFMAKIKKEVETLESLGLEGQLNFKPSSYINSQNKEQPCYSLNKNGMLQMLNSESALVRFKTVEYVEKLEEENKKLRKLDSYMIENPIERAKRWIEEEEVRQQLAQTIEEQKPKVAYFDELVDKNLLTNFRDTAKELKLKQNEFIDWLIDNKYIYRDKKNKIRPMANYTPSLFEIKEWSKGGQVGIQTLITPRGRETFRLLLKVKSI